MRPLARAGRSRSLNFGDGGFSSSSATADGHTGTISDSSWSSTGIRLDGFFGLGRSVGAVDRRRELLGRVGRCERRAVAQPHHRPPRLPPERQSSLRLQERVAVVRRRHERLLDRARRRPADEVPHRAGLVVRARGARAAERLLPDDRTGRLVVDVEVAGRVAQALPRRSTARAVAREDRAGERVRAPASIMSSVSSYASRRRRTP